MKKTIIFLSLILLVTACSNKKVYETNDTIEYKDITIRIVEDNIVTIFSNDETDVYLSIEVYNNSKNTLSFTKEQWLLEVNDELYYNKQIINDFIDLVSGEKRVGTISFSPKQYSDTIYLIIIYENEKIKIKLNDIL